MEVVMPIVGVVGAILAGIATSFIYDRKIKDHVSIRRIVNSRHDDAAGLVKLYLQHFKKKSDYTEEDMWEYLHQQEVPIENRPIRVEDFFLVAKYHGEVIGFLICAFYPDRRKAIIPYYAIDSSVTSLAQTNASRKLRKAIRKLLIKRSCRYLFFDVERPFTNLPKEELNIRKKRIRRFRMDAETAGLHAYAINFDYKTPKITIDPGAASTKLTLMVVPITDKLSSPISRQDLMGFLRFIYLDCYGDIYELSDPRHTKYHAHLSQQLVAQEKLLPETVDLI
ncbi:MAG TPA: hypothetical protein PKA82_11605 [Pyrinomonadaceae bacterium]|nr:hypothetical protein [Pyrinomonadaceae bacterium]